MDMEMEVGKAPAMNKGTIFTVKALSAAALILCYLI